MCCLEMKPFRYIFSYLVKTVAAQSSHGINISVNLESISCLPDWDKRFYFLVIEKRSGKHQQHWLLVIIMALHFLSLDISILLFVSLKWCFVSVCIDNGDRFTYKGIDYLSSLEIMYIPIKFEEFWTYSTLHFVYVFNTGKLGQKDYVSNSMIWFFFIEKEPYSC